MSLNTPIVRKDFHIVSGDPFVLTMLVYANSVANPVNMSGWVGYFSMRQNYGDAQSLCPLSTLAPTTQGTVAIQVPSGGSLANELLVTIFGSATAAFPAPMPQLRIARFFAQAWVVDLTGKPRTLWGGAIYVEPRL